MAREDLHASAPSRRLAKDAKPWEERATCPGEVLKQKPILRDAQRMRLSLTLSSVDPAPLSQAIWQTVASLLAVATAVSAGLGPRQRPTP
jgi:hypothetical protein